MNAEHLRAFVPRLRRLFPPGHVAILRLYGPIALNTADFLITPAWIIGGVLLWRRSPYGYVTSLGLLFQASMLLVALIAFLLLQPILTDAPFAPADVLVIATMGLVCFVPFVLVLRGVVSASNSTPPASSDVRGGLT